MLRVVKVLFISRNAFLWNLTDNKLAVFLKLIVRKFELKITLQIACWSFQSSFNLESSRCISEVEFGP